MGTDGARRALFNYLDRTSPHTVGNRSKTTRSSGKKKNKKPEAKFMLELKRHIITNHQWDIHIIEAKSAYSEQAGRYTAQHAPSGYSDLSGNTQKGLAVFIEVKAPGKRKTIRPDQYQFLKKKIENNCFAICTDSIDHFEQVLIEYRSAKDRKQCLMNALPTLARRYKDHFDDDAPLFG